MLQMEAKKLEAEAGVRGSPSGDSFASIASIQHDKSPAVKSSYQDVSEIKTDLKPLTGNGLQLVGILPNLFHCSLFKTLVLASASILHIVVANPF